MAKHRTGKPKKGYVFTHARRRALKKAQAANRRHRRRARRK